MVTYVNRMADTAYLPGWRDHGSGSSLVPRYWLLQLWTGDRWVWVYNHGAATVDGWGIPPIRVPPGGTLTHTVLVDAETLVGVLRAVRTTGPDPASRAGTYRLWYWVYRGWADDPVYHKLPQAPPAEHVSNTFTVIIQ